MNTFESSYKIPSSILSSILGPFHIPVPHLVVKLPDLPLSDWTIIGLTRNTSENNLASHSAERLELPSVGNIWYPGQVDYDLIFTKSFSYNVYKASLRDELLPKSKLSSVMMLGKFNR
jgi:hypothetical protein